MTNMSNMGRDMMKDAKDAARETNKAASEASGDIQQDLAALRDDVARLWASWLEENSVRWPRDFWERAKIALTDTQFATYWGKTLRLDLGRRCKSPRKAPDREASSRGTGHFEKRAGLGAEEMPTRIA